MKLRTSFFNPTVLKKDITRFAPVWALYTIFACLVVILMGQVEESGARFATLAPEILYGMASLNLVYAPAAAILLFGDLFQSKLCNALHAMPMRREGWFLTHLTAGLFFGIVPNLIPCLLACAFLGSYFYVGLLWLAVVVLQYLFFFGAGCFAVQCAGNRIGALAVYCIFNFFSVLVAWVGSTFYTPLLYGTELIFEDFAHYSPVVGLSGNYLNLSFDNMTDSLNWGGYIPENWRYLWICAGIGVLLLGASVLIYRKRNLESAGDMISFRPAAPVFLIIYTICAGAVLYLFGSLGGSAFQYIFLVLGLAIGFFTGKMLLERRVKVFNRKNLTFFLVFLVLFALSLGVAAWDPVGITRYIPESEAVESVDITMSHYFYDINNDGVTLTDKADIEDVRQVQKLCLENRYDQRSLDYNAQALTIQYRLTGGTTLTRKYYIDPDGEDGKLLKPLFSSVEAVLGEDPEGFFKNLRVCEVYDFQLDMPRIAISTSPDYLDLSSYEEKYLLDERFKGYYIIGAEAATDPILQGLLEAIRKDCEAGNMAQEWCYHKMEDSVISVHLRSYHPDASNYDHTKYLDLNIYESCVNTLAFLDSLQ